MKSKISFLLLVLMLLTDNITAQSKLESAKNEYNNFKIVEAKKIYQEIWASTESIIEKKEAGNQLIFISWKYYDDYESSKAYADSLLVLDIDNFDILIKIADISIQAKKFKNAEQYLKNSFKKAKSENQIKSSHIKCAEYVLLKSQKEYITKNTPDLNEVKEALDKLDVYYQNQPEDLQIVRLYLGLALILNDKQKIKDTWKTYFRIPQNKKATGMLVEAEKNIDKGLQLKDSINFLVKGLADSRFYDYAAMIIDKNNIDLNQNPDLKDIYNYYTYLNDIEKLIYGFYKDKLFNRESDEKYLNNYYSLCIDFWNKLDWGDNKPMFYEKAFEEELFKRFGAKINNGKGGNQIGFFIGHSVVNESRSIEQYGRITDLTYLSLDYIVGNIFPHWYFGFFGIGGWATIDNEVLQIRKVTFNDNSPLKSFNRLISGNEKEKWLKEIENISEKDDSIASLNPYALLPGLRERIKYNSYSQIIDSLKAKIKTQYQLKIEYLSLVDNILLNSSVYNHEGRHLLDSYDDFPINSKMYSSEEREFRAKLSEISFSADPKLIIAETILRSEGGAHEAANKRIVKGLVDWMEIHKNSIKGFDIDRPLLPQMDLLTNNQIIQAIQSFDPLYAEYTDN